MLKVDPADKQKLIDPLFEINGRYIAVVLVLASLVGMGFYLYYVQVRDGLVVTGMNRPVYWGLYMVNFVFFIGVSLAGTLTSAILRIVGVEWRRPITRLAEAITVFALIIASIQIVIDMGRPDRLHYVMMYGRLQSPILWDVVIVTTYLFSSVFYLYLPMIPDLAIIRDNMPQDAPRLQKMLYTVLSLGWRGNIEQWRRIERVEGFMAIFIVPVGVGVHTITSWLLSTTVQPGWHSTVFGPYFVVTAVFSGISALFIVMTVVRVVLKLEDYITLRQYRGLAWLYITMAITWAYFTYTETLTLVAGQQLMEFPVLASKLWGEFAPHFWFMIIVIFSGFIVMVFAQIMPAILNRFYLLQPPRVIGAAIIGSLVLLFLTDSRYSGVGVGQEMINLRAFGWGIVILCSLIIILGIGAWLRQHLVITAVVAGTAVIIGTWTERWLIIVPTLTHPRMIAWSSYLPTVTEVGLTIASVSLFILMFVLFFKIFPAVSIWETAEGRAVAAARAEIKIPIPQPSHERDKKRRWAFDMARRSDG